MLTEEQKTGIRDLARQDHGNGEPMWSGKSGLARWVRASGEAGDSVTGEFLRRILWHRKATLLAEVVYRSSRLAALTEAERSTIYKYGVEWCHMGPHGDTYSITRKGAEC